MLCLRSIRAPRRGRGRGRFIYVVFRREEALEKVARTIREMDERSLSAYAKGGEPSPNRSFIWPNRRQVHRRMLPRFSFLPSSFDLDLVGRSQPHRGAQITHYRLSLTYADPFATGPRQTQTRSSWGWDHSKVKEREDGGPKETKGHL